MIDRASIEFVNENELLSGSDDLVNYYQLIRGFAFLSVLSMSRGSGK